MHKYVGLLFSVFELRQDNLHSGCVSMGLWGCGWCTLMSCLWSAQVACRPLWPERLITLLLSRRVHSTAASSITTVQAAISWCLSFLVPLKQRLQLSVVDLTSKPWDLWVMGQALCSVVDSLHQLYRFTACAQCVCESVSRRDHN